jgi:hypothetical protein
MVQSYVIVRVQTNSDGSTGPREEDLQPYEDASVGDPVPFRWEDYSGRGSWTSEYPLFLNSQLTEPAIMVIHINSMPNSVANTMQSDPKLWMVASRRLEENEDGELEIVDNNFNDVYTAQERTTRINQLAAFTDFDIDQISNWWTPDKTRREVGEKLREYLRDINRPLEV